jgi:hypothetical protein
MAHEKIINGTFNNDLLYWTVDQFTWDAGKARAVSIPSAHNKEVHRSMFQSFNNVELLLAAHLTVWAMWVTYPGDEVEGYVRFRVVLEKPSGAIVVYYDATKSGSDYGYLLNTVSIKPGMTEYGNYKLHLQVWMKSAYYSGETESFPSKGWYDNVSVKLYYKKTKTVNESLGVLPAEGKAVQSATAENFTLSESLSPQVYTKLSNILEVTALSESVKREIKKTVMETIGLVESYYGTKDAYIAATEILKLVEGYSMVKIRPKELLESLKMVESFIIKKISGNLEITYFPGTKTQWTPGASVGTDWDKRKVVVLKED